MQRGNVSLSSLQVQAAILYVAEQGCTWQGLPQRFGRRHALHTRMDRWAEIWGTDQLSGPLQTGQMMRIKVHIDRTGV